MVRLFIENIEIELTEDVQVAITKQFEDLANPTTIINDWSKTVSIPFTEKNNQTFGHIYNPDKIVVNGGHPVGTYFNPLRKLNFRLEWGSNVIMVGYAKMNEIKQTNGKGVYNITLFGELGKVFQEMKKITFDTSTAEQSYLIDGSQYVDEYITKDLVNQSWCTEQYYPYLTQTGDSDYHVTDIIGFAPNNSFSDGFDYSTFELHGIESKSFTDVLGDSFTEDTGVEPDTAIPDGLYPREIGEYRSYLQLPFIYWNKLFQIFQKKTETITNYKFNLDESWFNNSNPYWHDLVYMLKPFDVKRGDTKDNSYLTYGLIDMWQTSFGGYNSQRSFNTNVSNVIYQNEPIHVSNNRFNLLESADYTTFKGNYRLDLETTSSRKTSLKSNNALLVHFVFTGQNGVTKVRKYLFTDDLNNTYSGTDDYTYVKLDTAKSDDNHDILRAYFSTFHSLKRSELGNYADLSVQYRWYADSYPYSNSTSVSEIHLNIKNLGLNAVITHNSFRSDGRFTLNDLWNKEYNLFNVIINYCKMYRIAISMDEFNKTISFIPYYKYFQNYTVTDWTDKIDKSKDFTIKPVTFENKYVLFNYKDSSSKLGKEYKEKYGVNYGDYRLTTQYNFNSETTNLFDKITPSITNTDNVLSWSNLYIHKIIYSFPAELYVYNKDDDGKQVDIFGAYFFHNGFSNFSTEASLNLRPVYISDDTEFQQSYQTFFYTQNNNISVRAYTYPKLDIVRDGNMCVFNVPMENYTYLNNYSGANSIYTNIWSDYLDERYSIQNKKITCYVDLKPTEYNQFQWNKLVKVGNQLCIVNKIYDYDVTSNGNTKVDLITIQNINGYNSIDYTYDYIIASKNKLTIPYDYYKKITVKSTGNWEIRSGDWTDFLVAYPTTGTSGETTVFIGSTDRTYGGTLYFDLLNSAGTEVIGSDVVKCEVGGTSTISVSQWYNEIALGGRTTVTVSDSSTDGWRLIASYTQASNVLFLPQSGGTGDTAVTLRQLPLHATTGVNDYYLENGNGDIVSFRLNVTT